MTNSHLGKYVFCAIRNVLWQLGYSCIYVFFSFIISALIAFIVWGITYALMGVDAKEMGTALSFLAFYVMFIISVICCLYPIYKKSLHKVFFKPYKQFTLYPTIDKINCKITLQYFIISILINLPSVVYNVINYHNIKQDEIAIPEITPLMLLTFVWSFFIVPFIATMIIVKKYSKFDE